MSDHRAWGANREEGMWWPGNVVADQQTMQQHQQFFQQQQQQMENDANAAQQQQTFNYKMANSFQNPATTQSNVTSTSPIGAAGIRGYDYNMTGGNPTLSAPAQGAQWWYPPSTMENMHNTLQSLQNSMHGMQQHQMPPVQNPSSPVSRTVRSNLNRWPIYLKYKRNFIGAGASAENEMNPYIFLPTYIPTLKYSAIII